jgi:hypothetical protein
MVNEPSENSVDKRPTLHIPPWLLDLPPALLRKIERLARRRGVSEAELTEQAIRLVEKERYTEPSDATPSSSQDTILVEGLGRVSVERAKRILRSISSYFGGRTKLDKKARAVRAQAAAKARWAKNGNKEKGGN